VSGLCITNENTVRVLILASWMSVGRVSGSGLRIYYGADQWLAGNVGQNISISSRN